MTIIFPFAVIDFEASSLAANSYPIEVGIAIARGPDLEIESWSSLIRPTVTWLADGHWDMASQAIHGIEAGELIDAPTADSVAIELNERLRGIIHAWADGGRYDVHWCRTLFEAATVRPTFSIADLRSLFMNEDRLAPELAGRLLKTPIEHRAEADAVRLLTLMLAAYRR